MAILDTFYLLFKSDTSDLKKGAEEVLKITSKLKSTLLTLIPTGFAIAGVKSAIDFGVELSRTSRLLNINANDLRAWSNAVELSGGNAAQFESTLSSLASRFGTTSDTVLKLLPRYADVLSRLSPNRAQQIGKNLGLDESTILLLQHGRREVEAMIKAQKELGGVSQKDAEQFLKYNDATIKVKQSTQALFTVLAIEALPRLIQFYDALSKGINYFIQHKDFVIGGIIAIGAAATAAGIAWGVANLPLFLMSALIIGAIGLFALIYDDIQAFLNGQKALLGYLANHYPQVFSIMKHAIESLIHPLDELIERFKILQNLYSKFTGKIFKTGIESYVKQNQTTAEAVAGLRGITSGASLAAGSTSKSVNVHVGDVTINTQATDSMGIASSFTNELNQQISQAANYHADGVRA